MMRTPEEIKMGLEYCADPRAYCESCVYAGSHCADRLCADALALIRQLEAKLDAALDPIRGECAYCAYLPGDTIPDVCFDCANKGFYRWELRAGQKED